MEITKTHHVDSSDPDDHGMYDYHYDYDIYTFSEGNVAIVARSYRTEPENAHFLRIEKDGVSRMLQRKDLDLPLFKEAVNHLQSDGKTELEWLDGSSSSGYSIIDDTGA